MYQNITTQKKGFNQAGKHKSGEIYSRGNISCHTILAVSRFVFLEGGLLLFVHSASFKLGKHKRYVRESSQTDTAHQEILSRLECDIIRDSEVRGDKLSKYWRFCTSKYHHVLRHDER